MSNSLENEKGDDIREARTVNDNNNTNNNNNAKGDDIREAITVNTNGKKEGPFGDDINAIPGKYRRLIPNEHPQWESPRPVRKNGPGGKYTSIAPPATHENKDQKQEEDSSTYGYHSSPTNRTSPTSRKQQHLLEEHLAGLQKELRMAQQLADSRLKDLQKHKLELVRVQTENSNMRIENATLKTSTKAYQKEATKSKQSLRDGQTSIRRLKNKVKSKSSELSKRTKALSRAQAQLASTTQQRDDLTARLELNEETSAATIQTLRDRVEAADRHYSEQLGYAKRELEDERTSGEKVKQSLTLAESTTKNAIKDAERTQQELQHEKNATQASATREKAERKQWKRLWSATVEKLQEENNNLWVQLQFMETALLEDELDRDSMDILSSNGENNQRKKNGGSGGSGGSGSSSGSGSEGGGGGGGNTSTTTRRRQTSPKEARRARRLLQKRVETQEDASQQATRVREMEFKLAEADHEQKITLGRLDFAETRVRDLLSELRSQDNDEQGRVDIEKGTTTIEQGSTGGSTGRSTPRRESTSTTPQQQRQKQNNPNTASSSGSINKSGRKAQRPMQQPQTRHQQRGQFRGGRKIKKGNIDGQQQSNNRNNSNNSNNNNVNRNSPRKSPKKSSNTRSSPSYSASTENKSKIVSETNSHPYFPTKEQLQDTVRKLRTSNKRLRTALANKEDLLKSALQERRRLLEDSSLRETSISSEKNKNKNKTTNGVSTELMHARRTIQRFSQRITAVKKETTAWHVQFRTELSLHGLYDEDKAPHHGTNITPNELVNIIINCVDALTSNKQNHKQIKFGTSSIDHVLDARGLLLNGTYLKLTVSRDEYKGNNQKKVAYKVSAYDPEACQEFTLNVSPETMLRLAADGNSTTTTTVQNEDIQMVDALVKRLVLSSVNGQRELQLGSDRTVAVRGSDPEEEMARLMGTGTQQQELDRIKRDIKMGLEEDGEIMDSTLIKRAAFAEVIQFDRKDEGRTQLLNVRLIDELDNNSTTNGGGSGGSGGNIIAYCTIPQDNRVKFRLVISRGDIDRLVPGGVDGQSRRRLCRLIVAQLKIINGALSLEAEEEEEEEDDEEEEVGEGEIDDKNPATNTDTIIDDDDDDDDDDEVEYTFEDEDDEEEDQGHTIYSGPITLVGGRRTHVDLVAFGITSKNDQEISDGDLDASSNLRLELFLPNDLQASLEMKTDQLPFSVLDPDNVDAVISWIANNVVVSWALNKRATPLLLLPSQPTVIFRGSEVVDDCECEICIFQVNEDEVRLEIAVRRGEWEDLRLFLKTEKQMHYLGKTWEEICQTSENGEDVLEALHEILNQLRFGQDSKGNPNLSML